MNEKDTTIYPWTNPVGPSRPGLSAKKNFPVDPVSEIEIIGADNFSGNIEGNFFYHYLAK